VVTPIDRSAPTEAAGAFAQALARVLALRHPDELTDAGRKAHRKGRLYIDVARNGWAQTAVAPYSVRPRPGAPVATPITWDELDDPDLRPDGWTVATVPDRLAAHGDPWAGMARHARSLRSRWQQLDALGDDVGDDPVTRPP
jgi:bifunctional non-homologous end joining protein LigD